MREHHLLDKQWLLIEHCVNKCGIVSASFKDGVRTLHSMEDTRFTGKLYLFFETIFFWLFVFFTLFLNRKKEFFKTWTKINVMKVLLQAIKFEPTQNAPKWMGWNDNKFVECEFILKHLSKQTFCKRRKTEQHKQRKRKNWMPNVNKICLQYHSIKSHWNENHFNFCLIDDFIGAIFFYLEFLRKLWENERFFEYPVIILYHWKKHFATLKFYWIHFSCSFDFKNLHLNKLFNERKKE